MDKNIDMSCVHGSCEEHELHVELLNSINEKMPSDEKIFDLAELFKMFGILEEQDKVELPSDFVIDNLECFERKEESEENIDNSDIFDLF